MPARLRTLTALILTAVLSYSCPAGAKDIRINAADYEESYNAGLTILSGIPGYLVGMDYPGDWVQYHFSVLEYGTHNTSITLMGTLGKNFHLELLLTADGMIGEQLLDFYFTGAGFG